MAPLIPCAIRKCRCSRENERFDDIDRLRRWKTQAPHDNGAGRVRVVRPVDFYERAQRGCPLLFVHIPKAAGHSIYELLRRNYPEDSLLIPYLGVEQNLAAVAALTAEERSNIRVVAGHMPVAAHVVFPESTYLTFLRDPLERAISAFYFNAEKEESPSHAVETMQNRTLLQFAEHFDNILTRYLLETGLDEATFWLSGETNPLVKDTSFLGLDLGRARSIRAISLKQWNTPCFRTNYLRTGAVKRIAVEFSDDNFESQCLTAAVLDLPDDREDHVYRLDGSGYGRFWRIRALSSTQTPRWGVVALRFFEHGARDVPAVGAEQLAVGGTPVCSSAAPGYSAANAFDGRDKYALSQIPPGALSQAHCEQAMDNLRERFLVGLTEQYDESVAMIGGLVGWAHLPSQRLNAGTRRRDVDMLTDEERGELAEINRFDVALYEFARRLYRSDLEYWRGIR